MWWFTTQYGSRVMLDTQAVPDDDPLARYWIDWDASPPRANSLRKLAHIPDAPGEPKYATHQDTCVRAKNRMVRR